MARYAPYFSILLFVAGAMWGHHTLIAGLSLVGMFGITTTANLSPAQQYMVDKKLLAVQMPYLQFHRFGQRRNLKRRTGKQIKFRRYEKFATTEGMAGTEGISAADASINYTDILATVALYTNNIIFSDLLEATEIFPFVAEQTKLLGINMGETIDKVDSGALVGGTNVGYANAVTARASIIQQFTEADVRIAVRALNRKDAKHISEAMNPTTGIGTVPVRAAFIAVIHPDTYAMLDNSSNFPSFKAVNTYPHDDILEGEVGSIGNVRFVMSSLSPVLADAGGAKNSCLSTTGTSLDVYQTLIFAEDAYGLTDLDGEGGRVIYKPIGSSGSADPAEQRGTIAWKSYHVCEILNDNWMYRLEHGCLANP